MICGSEGDARLHAAGEHDIRSVDHPESADEWGVGYDGGRATQQRHAHGLHAVERCPLGQQIGDQEIIGHPDLQVLFGRWL
ncbi:MAG TPA: hypothetical protein VFN75_05010 [Pseudonocardiaceae bacterium]|nr:hypothetical protein [Pseudonocardiaceae bacterium]